MTKNAGKAEDSKRRTIVSLFAGIGGIERGFELSGRGFHTVGANEWDEFAAQSYRANSKEPGRLIVADIQDRSKVTGKALLELAGIKKSELDVLSAGFPCQPFSIAGHRKGFGDARGNVFWDVIRLAKELNPKIIFLENVRNLETHDQKRTFSTIKSAVEGELGDPNDTKNKLPKGNYVFYKRVLNSSNFGVPQNRERIYMIGVRRDIQGVLELPDERKDLGIPQRALSDYIDFDSKQVDERFFCERYPFAAKAKSEINEVGAIYQWRRQYVRKNQTGVCPTLTANMGMGGHNKPIILTNSGRLRFLTPLECLKLMGFENFEVPLDKKGDPVKDSKLYKQAGNAVVVDVIKYLANKIADLLDANDKAEI